MAGRARLAVRVVFVPVGAGAADARRRVADVLLRASNLRTELSDPLLSESPPPDPPARSGEKTA